MSKDLRIEFEEFITSLTTQISNDIFLEDLKSINKSFSKLSKEYLDISKNYTENLDAISNELVELRNTNTNLNNINTNITHNSNVIQKALETLEGKHKIIFASILKDTKQHFNEYSSRIHELNEEERSKFKQMITVNINDGINPIISTLNKKIDDLNLDEVLKRQNDLQLYINQMTSRYAELQNYIEMQLNERKSDFENRLTLLENNTNLINNKTQSIFKQTRMLIIVLYFIIGGLGFLWLN